MADGSGSLISGKYNSAYWSFEWTSTVTDVGVSKVSWNLYARGRSSSPTQYYTKIILYINGSQVYKLWDEVATFTGKKYASGSFTVTHDEAGAGTFTARVYVTKIYDALSTIKATQTVTLPVNKPYSNCGAATLSLGTSNIIIPTGKITLNWSGATAGTANSINGYKIYRYVGTSSIFDASNATLLTTVGASVATYTDNFSNSAQTRGNNIIYKIITVGQATVDTDINYDSDYSNQVLTTINTLPPKPVLTSSSIIVPSRGGEATINLTSVKDSNATQSVQYYYSTNSTKPTSTSSVALVSSNTVNTPVTTEETTYYFWSHDGLEFSSSSTNFTIYINTKPRISFNTGGSILQSSNNNSGYNYINEIQVKDIRGIDGQTNNTYSFQLGYNTINSKDSATWLKLFTATSSSNAPLATSYGYNIRNKIGLANFQNTGYYYWIRGKRNDGLEDSDTADLGPYYVTKMPSFQTVFNKTYSTSVSGFEDYFLNNLYLRFDYDTGYDKVYLKIGTKDAVRYNITSSTNDKVSYVYLNTSDDSVYSRGNSISINHSFDNIAYIKDINQITKIYSLDKLLKNLISPWMGNTWKAYENTGSSSIGVERSNEYTSLEQLGLTNESTMSLNFKDSSTKKEIVISTMENSSTNEINYYSLSLENDYFNLLPSSFNFNGANITQLQLSTTNAFGEYYTIDSETFIVDFRTGLSNPSFHFTYNTSGSLVSTLTYLKELVPLYLNGSIKSYNTNPKGQIYIYRSTEENWQTYGPAFYFVETAATTGPTPGNPKTYSVSNQLIQTIGKILTEKYTASFKIVVTTDAGEAYKLENIFLQNIEIRGHFQGTTTLNNGQYESQNNQLLLRFSTKTLGLYADESSNNATVSMNLYVYQADKPSNFKEYLITPITTTLPAYKDFNEFSQVLNKFIFEGVAYAKIKITTTLKTNAGFSTEVVYETNEISFFNIAPTISYRPNQIGINYQNVEGTDCILALGEYQGKYVLRYYSATEDHLLGVIDNFILDGGTW